MSDPGVRYESDSLPGIEGATLSRPSSLRDLVGRGFGTILADPPWRFANRTGKVAPEHRRLMRYQTMDLDEICKLGVAHFAAPRSHLYLWVPNALVAEGLRVMSSWGFEYKTNVVWYKTRKDGGPDGRGVGFYFRNVTELVLFGVRGGLRTLEPGRRQVNMLASCKREHSRKPDELYDLIERCSPGPYLELFARYQRHGWYQWGDELGCKEHSVNRQLRLLEPGQRYRVRAVRGVQDVRAQPLAPRTPGMGPHQNSAFPSIRPSPLST